MTPPSAKLPYVLLDDSRSPDVAGRSYLFHSPERIVCARSLDEVPLALIQIDHAIANGFHAAGWIAYECAAAFEARIAAVMHDMPDEPLVWMLITRHRAVLDGEQVDNWLAGASEAGPCLLQFEPPGAALAEYDHLVQKIKDYIFAGDIYQANFTFPRRCQTVGSPINIYRQLRTEQPVEYGALIETGEQTVLSLSPELFVRREGDSLTARPMKGTAARRPNMVEDREAAIALSADPKSKAENLMIVDLIRNDLSRIAKPGSVSVSDLFTIETFPTLHQMTSGIEATCSPGLKPSQLLRALFPCGSITGAPKIRAMEILAALEQNARGIYCGAIGHFSPAGEAGPESWSLNVPIRTIVLNQYGQGRLAVGSGIVADSVIEAEYKECLLKARFAEQISTDKPFYLIETMRLEQGAIYLRERHLERLLVSAAHLRIPATKKEISRSIDEAVSSVRASGSHKLRLTLDARGSVEISVSAAPPEAGLPAEVAIADVRLNSSDPWLGYKSSRRDLYDRATACARDCGLADILFFNQQEELVEGAISSVFVETSAGWFTPPLSSGALPGVLRAELLHTHYKGLREKKLMIDDLKSATSIHIGNALRGLRAVTISAEKPDF